MYYFGVVVAFYKTTTNINNNESSDMVLNLTGGRRLGVGLRSRDRRALFRLLARHLSRLLLCHLEKARVV